MMKKYIKPEIAIHQIIVSEIIATSGDPTKVYQYEAGDGLSKGGDADLSIEDLLQ